MSKDDYIYELRGRLDDLEEEYEHFYFMTQAELSNSKISKAKLSNALAKLKTIQKIVKDNHQYALDEVAVVVDNYNGRGFKINEKFVDLEKGCAEMCCEFGRYEDYIGNSNACSSNDHCNTIYVGIINDIIQKYFLKY
eukprot:SAG11_NODE_228_length_11986_cov_128.901153_10_plen_138_part_00